MIDLSDHMHVFVRGIFNEIYDRQSKSNDFDIMLDSPKWFRNFNLVEIIKNQLNSEPI